ncbi:MAG TPA: amino acid ABC transporter substrate-binding protein, partial [Flavobacteriia bacterium]|nr:amino acid ABC transporter substrate-binding protein [Flavobacteriia bacterium]
MKNKILNLIIGTLMIFFIGCEDKKDLKNEINIGVVLPLSGGAAQYGKWIQNALELAKDEINIENEKKLNLTYEDDKANPKDAVHAIKKLTSDENIKVIFGSWASSCVMAMAPIAEKKKVLLFAEALSPNIKNAGEYIYRVQPDGSLYINKLVKYLTKNKSKNIGVVYINNDFGIEQTNILKSKLKIKYSKAYNPQTNDFKSIIENIKELNLEHVLVLGYKETAYFYKQFYEMGLKDIISIYGSVPTENPEVLAIAGTKPTNDLIYPHHFKGVNSKTVTKEEKEFFDKYKNKYGEYPEGFSYLAYEAMKFIIYPSIIKFSNKNIDTDKIKQYLDTNTFNGL